MPVSAQLASMRDQTQVSICSQWERRWHNKKCCTSKCLRDYRQLRGHNRPTKPTRHLGILNQCSNDCKKATLNNRWRSMGENDLCTHTRHWSIVVAITVIGICLSTHCPTILFNKTVNVVHISGIINYLYSTEHSQPKKQIYQFKRFPWLEAICFLANDPLVGRASLTITVSINWHKWSIHVGGSRFNDHYL